MFIYTDEEWEELISEYEDDLRMREAEYAEIMAEYND